MKYRELHHYLHSSYGFINALKNNKIKTIKYMEAIENTNTPKVKCKCLYKRCK